VSVRAVLARVAVGTGVAAILAVAVSPPLPQARLAPLLAVLAGLATGIALFVAVTRRSPRLALRPAFVLLGVTAAGEEVVWRRVLLGELLPVGAFAALTASSVAFALVHPRARSVHLATGASFGGAYVATGSLLACVAAHVTYNVLVGSLSRRVPP
jgi:membrane protease YdiL (CAAX protease family)